MPRANGGVLEMSEKLTDIGVRPARAKEGGVCIGCSLCYQACRDAAIEIYEVAKKVEEEPEPAT